MWKEILVFGMHIFYRGLFIFIMISMSRFIPINNIKQVYPKPFEWLIRQWLEYNRTDLLYPLWRDLGQGPARKRFPHRVRVAINLATSLQTTSANWLKPRFAQGAPAHAHVNISTFFINGDLYKFSPICSCNVQ